MTDNNKKSYFCYLNKLIVEHNNTCHRSIGKKPVDADYSALSKEIETNLKSPTFEVGDGVRIIKYKNLYSKGYTENCLRGVSVIDFVLKTNPWTNKIKDLNGEKTIISFYEK